MAEPIPTTTETPNPNPTPAAAGSSLLGKLMVLGFVAVVVTIECVVAYLCVPAPVQTEALAAASAKEASAEKKQGEQKEEAPEQSEVDLNQFTVTSFQPASNTTLRIAFHLYGTVATADAAEFAARLKDNQHRFREQVLVTLRGAEITDLTDAGLGLLKRTILEKTNATLGKPLLKSVIFSEFSFVELQ